MTQLCFDAGTLARWVHSLREASIEVPVTVGLPGAVERRKLAELSLRTCIGASLCYLRKHGREVLTMSRSWCYDPTPLARAVAGHHDEPGLDIAWCTCSRSIRRRDARLGARKAARDVAA